MISSIKYKFLSDLFKIIDRIWVNHISIKFITTPLVFITILLSNVLISQTSGLSHNYRIYPSDITQTEVFITISPINENILFSSCNTLSFIPFFVSEGIYTSTDGGSNWSGSDSCSGNPIDFHGGDPGIAIDKDQRFIITRLGRSPFLGLYSHFSYDNGQTWTTQTAISNDDLERASVSTDTKNNSSYYGRTYASWVKFAPPYPVMFSFVGSGSESWSSPQQINNPPNRSAGGDNAIGPDGTIHTCWAGVTNTSPFKEIYVGTAYSENGGDSWSVTENAFEVNGITGLLPYKGNIRVNGLPGIDVDKTDGERRGWVYVVTGQKDLLPAGTDPDIILNVSTDGGLTWSNGIRVNQDPFNNGKTQYFPSVHVDRYGGVNIIFYDDRNTTSDSTGVFLARSLDGGQTWKEWPISDHNFKPEAIGGLGQGYQGDNIDLTSTSEKLIPVWMDNSTGNYQIWTTQINFSEINFIDIEVSSSEILNQNFPNPFTDGTTIRYEVFENSHVSLTISNNFGYTIKTIINEMKKPGKYSITISANDLGLNSGTYYYSINYSDYHQTKTMVLID